jgi:hypothetical protein
LRLLLRCSCVHRLARIQPAPTPGRSMTVSASRAVTSQDSLPSSLSCPVGISMAAGGPKGIGSRVLRFDSAFAAQAASTDPTPCPPDAGEIGAGRCDWVSEFEGPGFDSRRWRHRSSVVERRTAATPVPVQPMSAPSSDGPSGWGRRAPVGSRKVMMIVPDGNEHFGRKRYAAAAAGR